MPAAAQVWPAVKADTERGIMVAAEAEEISGDEAARQQGFVNELDTAFANKDLEALERVDWMELAPYAEKGIQDRVNSGEISEGVAVSFRQRILQFSHMMGMLQTVVYYLPPSGSRTYWVDVPGVPSPVYAGTNQNLALSLR